MLSKPSYDMFEETFLKEARDNFLVKFRMLVRFFEGNFFLIPFDMKTRLSVSERDVELVDVRRSPFRLTIQIPKHLVPIESIVLFNDAPACFKKTISHASYIFS